MFEQLQEQTSPDASAFADSSLPPKPEIPVIARSVLELTDDIDEATNMFIKEMKAKHFVYWSSLANQFMTSWAKDQLRKAASTQRTSIARSQSGSSGAVSSSTISALGKTWLSWPVRPGLDMRSARKSDLLEAADTNIKRAKTMNSRGHWLIAIAEKLTGDKTVGETLNDDDLGALAKKFKVTSE